MEHYTEKTYQIALSLVPKIGDVLIRQLISYCGSAEQVFLTPKRKLLKIPNIGEILAHNLQQKTYLPHAEQILERAKKEQVQILFYTDEAYPTRLKTLYDAPALLYFKGKGTLNPSRSIAIVGTRKMTDYGKHITEQIVENLATHQVCCISGLAFGIDIVAHRACLKHHVSTLGIMANGINRVYPTQHKSTAYQMLAQGGILSEHPFGIEPEPHFFPQRNRIIAGMADAVVVVEAATKGGALITAEFANNYHKEVFAVPGQLGKSFSEGCNLLIRNNKAQIYTHINDLVEALNWDLPADAVHQPLSFAGLSHEEIQVMTLLHKNGMMHIDELSWQSQIFIAKLSSVLLSLEFQGFVKSFPGKKYGIA